MLSRAGAELPACWSPQQNWDQGGDTEVLTAGAEVGGIGDIFKSGWCSVMGAELRFYTFSESFCQTQRGAPELFTWTGHCFCQNTSAGIYSTRRQRAGKSGGVSRLQVVVGHATDHWALSTFCALGQLRCVGCTDQKSVISSA